MSDHINCDCLRLSNAEIEGICAVAPNVNDYIVL